MKSMIITFAILAMASLGVAQLCQVKLTMPEGKVRFPPLNSDMRKAPPQYYSKGDNPNKDCIYYALKNPFSKLQITFKNIKLTAGSEIKIKSSNSHKEDWKKIQTISGKIKEVTANVDEGRFVKVVVPSGAGRFEMEYAVVYCPVPSTPVRTIACTKEYRRDSHCIFQCQDDYFPKVLKDPKIFSRCRKGKNGGQWTRKIEEYCIPRSDIEENCLQNDTVRKCPYHIEDIIKIYGETTEKNNKLPDYELFDARLNSRAPAAVKPLSLGRVALRKPTGPSLNQPNITISDLKKKCKYHCILSSKSKKYYYSCGALKKHEKKQDCMRCRYVKPAYCTSVSSVYI